EHFGADHDVLREILRHPAADHEKAGVFGLHLELGQLEEILSTVPDDAGRIAAGDRVGDQTEPRRAVAERRAEDRHILLKGLVNDAVIALWPAVAVEV